MLTGLGQTTWTLGVCRARACSCKHIPLLVAEPNCGISCTNFASGCNKCGNSRRLMQVIPVFAGGLDFSLPVRKFFYDPLGSGRAFVQCVVSLTGFALVGGPARQDAPKAVTALKKLNVPYLVSLPLVFQTTEEWLESELGVHPVQVALQVAPRAPTNRGSLGRAGLVLRQVQVRAKLNAPCACFVLFMA